MTDAGNRSNLPPATGGVYTAQASVTINAPIDRVWNVLLDFPGYANWNPFVRSQVIVDKAKHALPDQTPSAGAVLVMNVDMSMTNGSKPSTKTTELITTVDHNQHRLSWRFVSPVPIPSWVFGAERWQALRVIDDGGETKVLYESREEFHGFAAYLVKWFVGKKVVKGFERTAVALKNLVEGA